MTSTYGWLAADDPKLIRRVVKVNRKPNPARPGGYLVSTTGLADVVGCLDYKCRTWSDGMSHSGGYGTDGLELVATVPATRVFAHLIDPQYRSVQEPRVFVTCAQHGSPIKRGLGGNLVLLIEDKDPLVVGRAVRSGLPALLAGATAYFDDVQNAHKKAVQRRLDEGRMSALLDAESALPERRRIEALIREDEYGASKVVVKLTYNAYRDDMTVVEANRLIDDMRTVIAKVQLKNERAIEAEQARLQKGATS